MTPTAILRRCSRLRAGATRSFALHAFDCEIARIRRNVSEPLPGEVRIQWWRDTIESGSGESLGHPLARSLFVAIERYALPKQAFLDLLDARIFDLYDDLMPSWSDLEGYCGETSAALVRLSAIILADGMDPGPPRRAAMPVSRSR